MSTTNDSIKNLTDVMATSIASWYDSDTLSVISKNLTDVMAASIASWYNPDTLSVISKNLTDVMATSIASWYNPDTLNIITKNLTDVMAAGIASWYDSDKLRNITKNLSDGLIAGISSYDFSAFKNSMKGILTLIDENDGFNYDDFESEEEANDFIEVKEIIKTTPENVAIILTGRQKQIFGTYIYPLILMVLSIYFSSLTSKPSIINNSITNNTYNTKYYISEVNNYYTINQKLDIDILSNMNLRFINRKEVYVRINPDNSSAVIGKLSLGKIVEAVEKYKKWVKIRWSDEDDNVYYGWTQNWKLSKFE